MESVEAPTKGYVLHFRKGNILHVFINGNGSITQTKLRNSECVGFDLRFEITELTVPE